MLSKRKRIRRQLRSNRKHLTPHYYASCYGKIQYSGYDQAKEKADDKPEIVRAYKCRYGNVHYHIGRRRTLWQMKRQLQNQ